MLRFRLFSLHISISIYFLGLIALMPFFDETGSVFFALGACFLHEMGHLLFLLLFYRRPADLRLGLFGMRLTVDELHLSDWQELSFVLAGPLCNFVAGLIFWLFPADPRWLLFNLAVGLFNLLPIIPLDGGNTLRILLCICLKDEERATRVADIIGIITVVMLVILLVYLFVSSTFNITLLIAVLYITALTMKN